MGSSNWTVLTVRISTGSFFLSICKKTFKLNKGVWFLLLRSDLYEDEYIFYSNLTRGRYRISIFSLIILYFLRLQIRLLWEQTLIYLRLSGIKFVSFGQNYKYDTINQLNFVTRTSNECKKIFYLSLFRIQLI